MKFDELSFTDIDEDGIERINDITNVIPNGKNSDEPYVIYTDYTLDDNDEFVQKMARLMQKNGEYYLETNISELEKEYILNQLQDDFVQYVNDVIEENLNE